MNLTDTDGKCCATWDSLASNFHALKISPNFSRRLEDAHKSPQQTFMQSPQARNGFPLRAMNECGIMQLCVFVNKLRKTSLAARLC